MTRLRLGFFRLFTLLGLLTLSTTIPALAQDVTPTPIPLLVPEIEGAQDAAIRSYGATGLDPTGMISIAMEVVRFDSADHAHEALETITERQMARLGQGGDTSAIQQASVDQIGDETTANAGQLTFTDTSSPIQGIIVGLVIARNGEFVFLTLAGSLAGNAVGTASDVTKAVIDRQRGDDATPVADNGMRSGGLWDMLPTLDDIPSGLVFDEDRVPVPFEPLPGQSDVTSSTDATETAKPDVVAYKRTGKVGDTWKVKVVNVIEDPYQIDPSATWFTDWLNANQPPAGQQIFTVRLRLTNTSDVAAKPYFDISLGLLGEAGFEYRNQCGQIPGSLPFDAQLRPGDSIDFNTCWVIDSRDVDDLTLWAKPSLPFDADRVIFALSK